jgi:hypothetical protein
MMKEHFALYENAPRAIKEIASAGWTKARKPRMLECAPSVLAAPILARADPDH